MIGGAQSAQFLRFSAVGSVGFVVDGGLLALFSWLGASFYVARALSFPVAVLVTYLLNRHWTFGASASGDTAKQLSGYLGVQSAGAITNYCVYATALAVLGQTATVATLGFVAGSAIGLVINFAGARIVFGARQLLSSQD